VVVTVAGPVGEQQVPQEGLGAQPVSPPRQRMSSMLQPVDSCLMCTTPLPHTHTQGRSALSLSCICRIQTATSK